MKQTCSAWNDELNWKWWIELLKTYLWNRYSNMEIYLQGENKFHKMHLVILKIPNHTQIIVEIFMTRTQRESGYHWLYTKMYKDNTKYNSVINCEYEKHYQ